MIFFRNIRSKAAMLLVCSAVLLGASAGSNTSRYVQENLVADAGDVAETINPNLTNPWGIARSSRGRWWIADNSSGLIIALTGKGSPYPGRDSANIRVPLPRGEKGLPSLTGIVVNNSPDFVMAAGKPARLIIVTEEGTIWGWNPDVSKDKAVLAVNRTPSAVYRGVTMGRAGGKNRLYAANFLGKSIDVFDEYFHDVPLRPGSFVDPDLPSGYAPYNVGEIGGRIYVAYGLQDSDHFDAERGAGYGAVTVFDTDGRLILRLKSGPELNAPWGMAVAPPGFGEFADMVLVGNTGDGTIAVYDPVTGEFKGQLRGAKGNLITIQGLRGITAGSNAPGAAPEVYFCAGIEEGEHGLFGLLKPGSSLK